MLQRIDASLKERAVRMLRDHRQDYQSDTALAEAVAKKLGVWAGLGADRQSSCEDRDRIMQLTH